MKQQPRAMCRQPVEKGLVKSIREGQQTKRRPVKARRTKRSTTPKKAVLYTLDPEVILLIERVAYHAGEAKSTLVNAVLGRELRKLPSATMPTEWE